MLNLEYSDADRSFCREIMIERQIMDMLLVKEMMKVGKKGTTIK